MKNKNYSFECYRCRFTNDCILEKSDEADLMWHYYDVLESSGAPNVFDYISRNLDGLGNEDAKRALSFLKAPRWENTKNFKEKFSVEPEDTIKVKKDLGAVEHIIENNTLKIGNFELQRVKLIVSHYSVPNLFLHALFGFRNNDVDKFLLKAPFDFTDGYPEILPLSYSPSSYELIDSGPF